jgi:hypothetical protein
VGGEEGIQCIKKEGKMILLLLFSVTLKEVIQPMENDIFRKYRGTVMVTYEQGAVEMEIIKSGKEILVQYLIPKEKLEEMPADFFSTHIPPISEEAIKGKKLGRLIKNSSLIETPVAYYNGEYTLGGSHRLISYVLMGYSSGLLYLIQEFHVKGSRLVGESGYGHRVEFDRSSGLPMEMQTAGKKIIFLDWRKVEGFGSLPGKVEVWVGGEKVGERKLKSVTSPLLESSFFSVKKDEIPIME